MTYEGKIEKLGTYGMQRLIHSDPRKTIDNKDPDAVTNVFVHINVNLSVCVHNSRNNI